MSKSVATDHDRNQACDLGDCSSEKVLQGSETSVKRRAGRWACAATGKSNRARTVIEACEARKSFGRLAESFIGFLLMPT